MRVDSFRNLYSFYDVDYVLGLVEKREGGVLQEIGQEIGWFWPQLLSALFRSSFFDNVSYFETYTRRLFKALLYDVIFSIIFCLISKESVKKVVAKMQEANIFDASSQSK